MDSRRERQPLFTTEALRHGEKHPMARPFVLFLPSAPKGAAEKRTYCGIAQAMP